MTKKLSEKEAAAIADRRIAAEEKAEADADLRLRSLHLAIGVSQPGSAATAIVGTAEAFHCFLSGATIH